MKKIFLFATLAVLLSACAPANQSMPKAELPAGKAYVDGKEIYFVHTESSDPGVAELHQHDELAGDLCANPGQHACRIFGRRVRL